MWGKLSIHGELDTNGAPSWKPLPFLFTVPYALFGRYALWLWMVTSVAISLAGPVFAWRIAFRLVDADPARRYAAYVAGLFAAVFVLLMEDPIAPANYMHYLLSAESDTMIVALCLAAVDFHLAGRHRVAFWMWFLGSLGRPEVWPFCGLAGIWLWLKDPAFRKWLYAVAGALAVPLVRHPRPHLEELLHRGQHRPEQPARDPRQQGHRHDQALPPAEREHDLGAGAADARVGDLEAQARDPADRRGRGAWLVIEIAMALKGFPAVPRYMFEPGAIVCVLAGVCVGCLILEVPPLLGRGLRSCRGPKRDAAGDRSARGAPRSSVVLIAGSTVRRRPPPVQARARRPHARAGATQLIGNCPGWCRTLGASRILACGQPDIPIELPEQIRVVHEHEDRRSCTSARRT